VEMEQPQLPPQKSTPARRRVKRPVNSPARKMYASENDMGTTEPLFPIELARPATPQKSASNSPAPATQPNQPRPNKPRNGVKLRAKQVTSPGPAKQGRTTPPQTILAPRAIAPAFAGATFHASPAPSSLPIPSFLAKALDSPAVPDTGPIGREPSPPVTDSEAPTPQRCRLPTDIVREESPLDFFFRADRAEKERARRASSANILAPIPSPFSPPAQARPLPEPQTLPSQLFGSRNRRPGYQRNPSSGISANELDGTPGRPMGPAFSTPYQDRIRAAATRANPKQAQPAQRATLRPAAPPLEQPQATLDLSEKLKRFLSIPPAQGGQQDSPQTAALSKGSAPQTPVLAGTEPVSASSVSTTSAATKPDTDTCRSPQILHMEDSLRRMLKIDAGPSGLINHQSA
ncbi:hypothetical protein BT67DRAFT_370957, partial [Trichocladium antarcticum]